MTNACSLGAEKFFLKNNKDERKIV